MKTIVDRIGKPALLEQTAFDAAPRVDRAEPSGNDCLADATTRPHHRPREPEAQGTLGKRNGRWA